MANFFFLSELFYLHLSIRHAKDQPAMALALKLKESISLVFPEERNKLWKSLRSSQRVSTDNLSESKLRLFNL